MNKTVLGNYSKVRNFLDRHKFLDLLQRCFRYRKNESFRGLFYEPERSFYFKQLGNENIGKVVFLYEEKDILGFFAAYRRMIHVCGYCEQFGFVPVFHFDDTWPYSQVGVLINGKTDSYEHYFMQPGTINYEEALKSNAVVIPGAWQFKKYFNTGLFGFADSYHVTEEYLKNAGECAKKYLKLNPELELYMNDEIDTLLGNKKTLAVHVRIKVFQLQLIGHPIPEDLEQYIEEAKSAVEKFGFEQVFLATEETETLEAFRSEFKEKLVYYDDVFRNESGGTEILESDRENHKYRLGYEVMRDMNTLARCDGLIAGFSQVAICAQITKFAMKGRDYDYKKIFDKGVYTKGITANESDKVIQKNNQNVNK